jgi:hypothetical protein
MAETLLLAHTFGRAGWEVAHAGGSGEFALAAVGQCFVQRRLLFNLPLLWRLRKLWREGMSALDPKALRLAMCVDERVRVSGVRLDVALIAPADEGAKPQTLIDAALPLPLLRERDARLPPAEPGMAWRVHALGADGVRAFRKLARGFAAADKGVQIELRASARDSRSPAALRGAFPLRIDLLFDAAEGYVTLVPARTLLLSD